MEAGMEEWTVLLQQRIDKARVVRPDTDPRIVGTALIDVAGIGEGLDAHWSAFTQATRDVVCAHGLWEAWSDAAGPLAGYGEADTTGAFLELFRQGWVSVTGAFTLPVICWRRARLSPSEALVAKASGRAEAAFHASRLHDHLDAPSEVVEELARWASWSRDPEVYQWAQVARRELAPEDACEATKAWALFNASRQAHLSGWTEESTRLVALADEHARDERSRFVVAYIHTMRAVTGQEPSAGRMVKELGEVASTDNEQLMALQVRAELERRTGRHAEGTLVEGMHLARRLGLRSRELYFLLFLALQRLGDAKGLRELVEAASPLVSGPYVSPSYTFVVIAAHLLESGFEEAYEASIGQLGTEKGGGAFRGRLLAVAVVTGHLLARDVSGLRGEARRLLMGTEHIAYLRWMDRVLETGESAVMPLPFAELESCLVAADGSWFRMHGVRRDLSDSALARSLLGAIAESPRTGDELIDIVWPGDASSFLSLKNRLHALVRSLRRSGLENHLVFQGGKYALSDVEVVPV